MEVAEGDLPECVGQTARENLTESAGKEMKLETRRTVVELKRTVRDVPVEAEAEAEAARVEGEGETVKKTLMQKMAESLQRGY